MSWAAQNRSKDTKTLNRIVAQSSHSVGLAGWPVRRRLSAVGVAHGAGNREGQGPSVIG
jgi:hypothetical protein